MSLIKRSKVLLLNLYMRFCHVVFGVKPRRVVFSSFDGKSYSDNPKAVSETLHRMNPDIEIIWGFVAPETKKGIVPGYVKCVDMRNYLSYYKALATSSVWVNNFSPSYIPKSKKQCFIQTWHGDRAFKKVLCDSEHFVMTDAPVESVDGYCDYAIAGSGYGEQQYRSAFLYKGRIIKEGTPRNDCLINSSENDRKIIKEQFNVGDKMILLYAPTLRRQASATKSFQDAGDIDIESTIKALEAKYECEWVCFVRAHSAVKGLSGIKYNDKVIDVSSYEDMADLLLISDMLITDYSSCAGDFALLHRPVVLYQADYDKYIKDDRTLYFNMSDSPYWVAKNQNDLNELINNMTDRVVCDNCDDILNFYETNETGKASECVAELMIKHIDSVK